MMYSIDQDRNQTHPAAEKGMRSVRFEMKLDSDKPAYQPVITMISKMATSSWATVETCVAVG